ncbi:MAG: YbhB/YbcL family Raf kinase inhibitor-like protein [Promethearchaeota archaeon]
MKKRLIGIGVLVLLMALNPLAPSEDRVTAYSHHKSKSSSIFSLTSPDFDNGSYIPDKYTCKGSNVNPELEINNVPAEAQSLALIMDDPDAVEVAGYIWVHWLLWNISPSITVINENSVPDNAIRGRNSWSDTIYGGPCPPLGRDHLYFFKLYALDIELTIPSTNADNLIVAMNGHIIDQTVLTGRYSKSGPPSPTTTTSSGQATSAIELVTLLSSLSLTSFLIKKKKGSKR